VSARTRHRARRIVSVELPPSTYSRLRDMVGERPLAHVVRALIEQAVATQEEEERPEEADQ
jgi:predicted O-methyltransferase YrrM